MNHRTPSSDMINNLFNKTNIDAISFFDARLPKINIASVLPLKGGSSVITSHLEKYTLLFF